MHKGRPRISRADFFGFQFLKIKDFPTSYDEWLFMARDWDGTYPLLVYSYEYSLFCASAGETRDLRSFKRFVDEKSRRNLMVVSKSPGKLGTGIDVAAASAAMTYRAVGASDRRALPVRTAEAGRA